MNITKTFCLSVLVLVLSSCAGREIIPEQGQLEQKEGISLLHPEEYEKNGTEAVTLFYAIMNDGLWYETVNSSGVFPVSAYANSDVLEGQAFVAELNQYGDRELIVQFPYTKTELEGAKYVVFNQDGGFAYNLEGGDITFVVDSQGNKERIYDPGKFSNADYREEFFDSYGTRLLSFEKAYRAYHLRSGKEVDNFILECRVGSDKWNLYKEAILIRFPHEYIDRADGVRRIGVLPFDQFRSYAAKLTGRTANQRFWRNSKASIGIVDMAVQNPISSIVSSAVRGGIDASFGDKWTGRTLRSWAKGVDVVDRFKSMANDYKEMIRNLLVENHELKTAQTNN